MDYAAIKKNLTDHFIEIYPVGDDLTEDTDLLNDWFIDSFAIVQTVMFIEEQYNIFINHDDINEENFFSVKTLSNFILM